MASMPPTKPPPVNFTKKRIQGDEYTGLDKEQGSQFVNDRERKRQKSIETQNIASKLKSIDTNASSLYSRPHNSPAPKTCVVPESRRVGNTKERADIGEGDECYKKLHKEFAAQNAARGTGQSDKERKEQFKSLVRTKVFAKVKFIIKDSDLNSSGLVYNIILKQLKTKEKEGVNIEQYWTVHRKFVRETLNTKRGAVNGMMKAAFMSKYEKVCWCWRGFVRKWTNLVNILTTLQSSIYTSNYRKKRP